MRILVATIVHHPEDARILHRQILALVNHGHTVTYLAPFEATGTKPRDWVTPVDVPRASGRQRLHAIWAARREIAKHAGVHDLLLLHDPELVLSVAGLRRPPTVWDVHEDTAASMFIKPWLPRLLRPAASSAARLMERGAERRMHLLLAEEGYVDRFRRPHPVIPNLATAPDRIMSPGDRRVIYVGHLSRARGALDLVEVARLTAGQVELTVVGSADAETRPALEQAHRDSVLRWYGYLPNDQALPLIDGALAGLSLIHDERNYRGSRPTKVVEYMARGVPVVTTPNPQAVSLVTEHDCGVVVSYQRPAEVAAALLRLRDDPKARRRLGQNGYRAARMLYYWPVFASDFVAELEHWADRGDGIEGRTQPT